MGSHTHISNNDVIHTFVCTDTQGISIHPHPSFAIYDQTDDIVSMEYSYSYFLFSDARGGIEPPNNGFADRPINHSGIAHCGVGRNRIFATF